MKKDTQEYRTRLKEMTAVLRKYGGIRGLTPQKLRKFLEELGPTYVKLGQILSTRSDMIPKKYCEELMHLCSDVEPDIGATVLSSGSSLANSVIAV